MKNWKTIAEASGIQIPPADLDRIAAPLNALEQTFRPLVANLSPELEPAVTFQAEEGE